MLERFADASLLQFEIETGRQHQIRVHAQAIGHPILLDPLYGDGVRRWPEEGEAVISRHALHSSKVSLTHPRSGERLTFTAPLPPDLQSLLTGLRGC